MKITITALSLISIILITLPGCSEFESSPNTEIKRLQAKVMIYDVSISTDSYAILTNNHIEKIYSAMGRNGGGIFYGLHVQSNSLKQDPVIANVPALQQVEIKGNAYQQANRERKNKQLALEFENGKKEFCKTVSDNIVLPKNHNFSDIKNALEIACKILKNRTFDRYEKSLIIISDMENDFPPSHGIDKMSPVYFDNDVNVIIVRPSDKVKIEEMIPGVNYTIYVTIDDALNSLNPN